MLGELLGETLRLREGQELFETVERVRALSKDAAGRTARATSTRWPACCGTCRWNRQCPSRGRSRTSSRSRTSPNSTIACGGGATTSAIPRPGHNRHRARRPFRGLIGKAASTPDALYEAVCALRIELVLTAHPTEITRRTLIHKHLHIAAALMQLDRPDLTVPERAETIEELRARDRRRLGDRRDPARGVPTRSTR